ncbi:MAG: hypothetical protein HZB51_04960 [Chloroflexi bacterium]|nr:hypothetical protein [Chloroflexota bacterium]
MSYLSPTTPIQYVAEIKHVKEVTLYGVANLEFWQNCLKPENLIPFQEDGKAHLFISATELVYMGIKFREVSFSVYVADPKEVSKHGGFYLIHAFNSSRLFAFSERTMFQTPYYHGTIQVKASIPSEFKLMDASDVALKAKMSGVVPCSKSENELWEGPIFLPKYISKGNSSGGVFYAKLGGLTETYPFSPSMDTLEFKPTQNADVIRWLVESKFMVKEWRVRQDAEHAKSKTYRRD